MKIRKVQENVGAGFSMSSGGRGGSNIGSKTTMYTYEIKPLNHSLEPKPSDTSMIPGYNIGNRISGTVLSHSLDSAIKINGIIRSIEKTELGKIKYFLVQDESTQQICKVDPTSIKRIHELGVEYIPKKIYKRIVRESLLEKRP